jgi:hypothetical protein
MLMFLLSLMIAGPAAAFAEEQLQQNRAPAANSGLLDGLVFRGPTGSRPLLSHMHSLLQDDAPRARHAAAILARLGRGQEIIDDPRSAPLRLLHVGGFISSDDNGMVRFRNRIIERVFARRATQRDERQRQLRILAIGTAVTAALVLLPYWYLRVLPAAEIAVLTSDRNLAAVAEAHADLGRLPGFSGAADRLFGDAMVRLGGDAESIGQLRQIDAALRVLPDGPERADALTGQFWLRRARALASRGESPGEEDILYIGDE